MISPVDRASPLVRRELETNDEVTGSGGKRRKKKKKRNAGARRRTMRNLQGKKRGERAEFPR